jgi:hypothetical protein
VLFIHDKYMLFSCLMNPLLWIHHRNSRL